jgi:hypothetical protein
MWSYRKYLALTFLLLLLDLILGSKGTLELILCSFSNPFYNFILLSYCPLPLYVTAEV